MKVVKGYKQTDIGVIPEDWEVQKLGHIATKIGSGITPTGGEKVYKDKGRTFIRSQNVGWGKLILDDVAFIDDETHSTFQATEIKINDVLLNITGASIGRSAMADERIENGNVNQHVCIIRTPDKILKPQYLNAFLLSNRGQKLIDSFQTGGNRQGLNFGQIKTFSIPFPPTVEEQNAITSALNETDTFIFNLEKLILKKQNIKQGTMQVLLTGKKRLKGFRDEWQPKKLSELLDYEQPVNYLVKNTEYNESTGIPVLTANKSFILGYTDEADGIFDKLPVIIFDDFTTASRYVTFPFKIKSSAIKILKPKNKEVDLRFVVEKIKRIQFTIGDHKRYYISEYQNILMEVPSPDEQRAISKVIGDMDAEIEALQQQLSKFKLMKQGMMQNLLTGKIRLTETK